MEDIQGQRADAASTTPDDGKRTAMPESIVDSHHHLWEMGRFPYAWLSPGATPRPFGDHTAIKTDYLPHQYRIDMEGLPVVATVHVQANSGAPDPCSETNWLAGLAIETGLPDAVVGFADLTTSDVSEVLDAHMRFEITRGMRALVAFEADDPGHFADRPHILREPAFLRGAEALARRGLSLDLVIVAGQMPEVADLARRLPKLSIIVDHLAMPRPDKPGDVSRWTDGLQVLGELPNVSTKLSGMWTIDRRWNRDALAPYIDDVVARFGPSRVMYGSNLPIEKLMCPARHQIEVLTDILAPMGPDVVHAVFCGNAERIYRLSDRAAR